MKKNKSIFSFILCLIFLSIYGFAWTTSTRLTYTSGNNMYPAVALDSNNHLHLIYQGNSGGVAYEVYYKKSTNGGTSWTSPLRVTWNSGDSIHPTIFVDNSDRIHIAWYDDTTGDEEIYYKRSGDGGTSFSSLRRMTYTSGRSEKPVFAVNSSGNLFLFWSDKASGHQEIYFKLSTDGGVTWSGNNRVTWSTNTFGNPDVVIDANDEIHLCYNYIAPPYGSQDIYYKRSADAGTSWTSPTRLTWDDWDLGGNEPSVLGAYSNDIHLTWMDRDFWLYGDDRTNVYYKYSTNGGVTWASSQKITYTGYNLNEPLIGRPDIAVNGSGNPHLVWSNLSPGNHELYYKKSTNGGSSWAAQTRLTWNSGDSTYPVIVINSSGVIYIFWQDDTTGTSDIYFKRSS